MRRGHFVLLVGLAIASIVGCKVVCNKVKEQVVSGISGAIVVQLQCKNAKAVREDIENLVDKVGVCSSVSEPGDPVQGPIADMICPPLAELAVSELTDALLKDSWQCSAQNAKAAAVALVSSTCRRLPF